LESTSAAQSGGQIRLTGDPAFQDTLRKALALLQDPSKGEVTLKAFAHAALDHIGSLSSAELETVILRIDICKDLEAGAVRLSAEASATLNKRVGQHNFLRARKDSRARGVWSRRAMLIAALQSYAEHITRAHR